MSDCPCTFHQTGEYPPRGEVNLWSPYRVKQFGWIRGDWVAALKEQFREQPEQLTLEDT